MSDGYAEAPRLVLWELTQACELACEHCRAEAHPERHPGELSTDQARDLLADLRRFGEDQLVVLTGGDPLARPDLPEIVAHGTDLGLRMSLTPSGTTSLTFDRIADLTQAGLGRLALSLDGATAERHDAFRGEPGCFASTMDAAAAAHEAGLPLQVNTTVCASTVDDLPEIADRVADLGAVMWSVFFLVPVGRGSLLDQVPPKRAERVMTWLDDLADEAPFAVKTTEAPHYRRVRLTGTDETPADAGHGVRAGKGVVFVSHVGEIQPSGFFPLPAGRVPADSVVDVYRESELFRSLRDESALEGKCGACPYREVCGGSRSRAYATTGNALASDPLCPYRPPGYEGPMPDPTPHVPGD